MGGSFPLFRGEDMQQYSVLLKTYPRKNTTKMVIVEKTFEKKKNPNLFNADWKNKIICKRRGNK
jgi:hypothetical protein